MTRRLSSLLTLPLLALGGCVEGECSCVAPPPVVTGVAITGAPTLPMRVGTRILLAADIRATGVLVDRQVIWRTSAPGVVEVGVEGLATAVGVGTATVEAIVRADTTKRGSVTIRVEGSAAALR